MRPDAAQAEDGDKGAQCRLQRVASAGHLLMCFRNSICCGTACSSDGHCIHEEGQCSHNNDVARHCSSVVQMRCQCESQKIQGKKNEEHTGDEHSHSPLRSKRDVRQPIVQRMTWKHRYFPSLGLLQLLGQRSIQALLPSSQDEKT